MPHAVLTGWISDVRRRVRFIPADAFLTSLDEPAVPVFNRKGHFFVPYLEAGKTYRFIARNGRERRIVSFTPKRGFNELDVPVRTKPARSRSVSTERKPTGRKPSTQARSTSA